MFLCQETENPKIFIDIMFYPILRYWAYVWKLLNINRVHLLLLYVQNAVCHKHMFVGDSLDFFNSVAIS